MKGASAFVLAAALGAPLAASAAQGPWTSGGPYGGYVSCLAIDPVTPSTLYAGTRWQGAQNGVYRSLDAGGTWSAVRDGLPAADVNALAVDPVTTSILYAATESGVFRSIDSGASWTPASSGLSSLQARGLAIDPSSPSTLYAATAGGVFRSADSGGHWTLAGDALAATAVTVDRLTPATLWAVVGGGVSKSTDSGATWSARAFSAAGPNVIAISPASSAVVWVGTTQNGVLRTTDGGATWAAPGGVFDKVFALAIDSATPSTLYAGTHEMDDMELGTVFRSTDSGTSWSYAKLGLNMGVHALAIDPAATSTLYAGTYSGGVLRSTDSGIAWGVSSRGLARLGIRALAVHPSAPATLYAGSATSGVFTSTDSGATWSGSWAGAATSLSHPWVSALAISRSSPSTLYAGTYGFEATVYRSTDSGASWAGVGGGGMFVTISALAVDPVTPTTFYEAVTGSPCILRKWTSSGSVAVLSACAFAVAVDPSAPALVYAGSYRSTDAGASWAQMPGLAGVEIHALAIDPAQSSTVYAGASSSGGVFKSTDSGSSWSPANSGLADLSVNALAIHPTDRARVYAGTDGGCFESTDAGGTWARADSGGPAAPRVSALGVDAAGATLFAGFFAEGVWRSPVLFRLTTSTTAGGTVTSDPPGEACGSGCATYAAGTAVSLTTHPQAGFRFAGWSGACSGAGACSVTMDADRSVAATFVAAYALSTAVAGTGSGTIAADPPGTSCGSGCALYDPGTVVTLTATPGTSSVLSGWSGACSGTGTCSVVMDAPKSVTATFAAQGASGGGRLYVVAPCRLYDSRGGAGIPLAAGATRTVAIAGASCGVAADAGSAAVNVTVTQPGAAGFLAVYPSDHSLPNISSVNFAAGVTRANNAVVALPADGSGTVSVTNGSAGSVHVIVDVSGYFR